MCLSFLLNLRLIRLVSVLPIRTYLLFYGHLLRFWEGFSMTKINRFDHRLHRMKSIFQDIFIGKIMLFKVWALLFVYLAVAVWLQSFALWYEQMCIIQWLSTHLSSTDSGTTNKHFKMKYNVFHIMPRDIQKYFCHKNRFWNNNSYHKMQYQYLIFFELGTS